MGAVRRTAQDEYRGEVALANKNARVLRALLAHNLQLPRPVRLKRALGKTWPKELRRLSAKLMANRSDHHLLNLSNCQGTQADCTDQEKVRGFPSWPGAQRSAPAKGRIHDHNPDQSNQKTATLRTGLGPYMPVRIHFAPL